MEKATADMTNRKENSDAITGLCWLFKEEI